MYILFSIYYIVCKYVYVYVYVYYNNNNNNTII